MRASGLRLTALAIMACGYAGPAAVGESGTEPGHPPQITDVRGDANMVNGQGVVDAVPRNQITDPASLPAYDILAVRVATFGRYKSVKGRKTKTFTPDGFTVSLELAAAPGNGAFRVRGRTAHCDTFMFQYFADQVLGVEGYLRHTCTDSGSPPDDFIDVPIPVSVVGGTTLVWRVTLGQLPKQVTLGTLVEDLTAETLGEQGGVTAPVIDDAPSGSIYRVGEAP